MRCPFCNEDNDKVVDSRSSEGGIVIRRRRECLACTKRFTTYERIEDTMKLMVVKKDGSRVPYERQKLLRGLELACYKRPVAAPKLQKLVDQLEDDLHSKFDREVDSATIGQLVSGYLRQLDQVAYVRFASVYKQFRDIEEFFEEVREVMDSSGTSENSEQGKLFK